MGKTIGRIIAVVTSPVSLIDRNLGNIARSVIFTAVGTSIGGPLGGAIGAALAGGVAALDRPQSPPPPAASTSIKTSRPTRVGAYGVSRLYGAYILYETGDNGAAVDGYAIHDGPMTAAIAFYIGDDKVTHKSGVSYPGGLLNGLPDGRYGDDTTRIYWTDGRTPGTTIPVIYSDLPGVWSANHRGDGMCLLYARFASVKSKNFLKRFPNGAAPASIVAQWQKCPDPWAADPCDDTAWTWTENPIRQIMHYMLYREAPRPTIAEDDPDYYDEMMALRLAFYGRKIAPSLATWRAASDVCDEAVTLKAGGTEARYRSCYSHELVTPHGEVKNALLSLCDGWSAIQSDGSMAVYAGKYYTPTVTIGPDEILAYDWEGVGVDDDSATNEIVCSYVSADHDYNSVECDAWRDEDDIGDRGALLSETLSLQTLSWGQVRRLAKRKMARTNAPFRGSITTNIAGEVANGHRFIDLEIIEAGATYYSGPAEITAVTRNTDQGGITFSWVAANPNIDAWNAATEEGLPAAMGDRVAPAALTTPTIISAVAEPSPDGQTVQIRIIASGPDRNDLTWYVGMKSVTDTIWVEAEYSDVDPGALVELLTASVPSSPDTEVRVAYLVGDGRLSDWSDSETGATSAEPTPPAPTILTVVTDTNEAEVAWESPVLARSFGVEILRTATSSFTGATTDTFQFGVSGAAQSITYTLASGSFYWWVRTRTASGALSVPSGPIFATVP